MKTVHLLLVSIIVIVCTQCDTSTNTISKPQTIEVEKAIDDSLAISELLEKYKTTVNNADTTLAKTIWLTTPDVSFIHPRGHEKGWEGIKSGVYQVFATRFTEQVLKSYNETITIYGDMAVLEFYWIFDAMITGDNPRPYQTKGRETQVLKKIDNDWRIVHIHYSHMPD